MSAARTEPAPAVRLHDGTVVPQLGFGTLWVQPDRRDTDANAELTEGVVGEALRAGYRHLDTAQSYGTERGVGRAVRTSGLPRDDVYVTSKLANWHHDPRDVERSFDETLARMGLDRLDLFLIHWPLPTLDEGDFVSTWRAVATLLDDGRLRSAGVSNFLPEHLDRIVAETGVVPVVNQVELHPYFANPDVRAADERYGVVTEAHSPLGKRSRWREDPVMVDIAAAQSRTLAQVALRWNLQHGHIVIPKTTDPTRMRENLEALDFSLTDEQMRRIDALDRGPEGRTGPHPATHEG